VVLSRMRPAERIEREPKPFSELLLDSVHLRAILLDREPGLVGGEFRRGAVLIGRTNEQDFVPLGALESRIRISRKHRANEITQMLNTVDIGQRRRDKIAAHLVRLLVLLQVGMPLRGVRVLLAGRDASPRRPTSTDRTASGTSRTPRIRPYLA